MGDAVADHQAIRLTETTQHVHLPDVSDQDNPLPQMLCSVDQWTENMKKLHIRRTDTIILYDPNPAGLFSVCRIALMFRYFGSQNVRILNGGLKKWISEGKPTFSGAYVPGEGLESDGDYNYYVVNENLFVKDISIVHNAAHEIFNGSTGIQILDARPHVLTYGNGRTGFLGGHISGSKNVNWSTLLNENGTIKSDEEIEKVSVFLIKIWQIFTDIEVDPKTRTINSCGSGVTACIIDLALRLTGSTST